MKLLVTISLALLFTASSFSFQLSTHSCGGELVSWAVWGDAEPCMHSRADAPVCSMHSQPADTSKNCCDDHAETVTGLVPNTVVRVALEAPVAIPMLIAVVVDHISSATSAGHGWSLADHFRPPPMSGWAIHILDRAILL